MIIELFSIEHGKNFSKSALLFGVFHYNHIAILFLYHQKEQNCYGSSVLAIEMGHFRDRLEKGVMLELFGKKFWWTKKYKDLKLKGR